MACDIFFGISFLFALVELVVFWSYLVPTCGVAFLTDPDNSDMVAFWVFFVIDIVSMALGGVCDDEGSAMCLNCFGVVCGIVGLILMFIEVAGAEDDCESDDSETSIASVDDDETDVASVSHAFTTANPLGLLTLAAMSSVFAAFA